jgi:tetrahydromethanopterin S-methyltransferase subunit H
MINEIKFALKCIWNIPVLVFSIFYGIYGIIVNYRKGLVDMTNMDDIIKNCHELIYDVKQYAIHINWAFWILVVFLLTK